MLDYLAPWPTLTGNVEGRYRGFSVGPVARNGTRRANGGVSRRSV